MIKNVKITDFDIRFDPEADCRFILSITFHGTQFIGQADLHIGTVELTSNDEWGLEYNNLSLIPQILIALGVDSVNDVIGSYCRIRWENDKLVAIQNIVYDDEIVYV